MIKTLKITILVDNSSSDPDLQSEHGFSLWIEADNKKILFDTGHSKLIVHNAAKLDINLGLAQYLILSHGHYDHTGAVAEIVRLNPSITIFCHPFITNQRFSRQPDGYMKLIGSIPPVTFQTILVSPDLSRVYLPLKTLEVRFFLIRKRNNQTSSSMIYLCGSKLKVDCVSLQDAVIPDL
jgi:glyoxylase-like metal-dependent hydrolase (beta-lactamase superfamily II)